MQHEEEVSNRVPSHVQDDYIVFSLFFLKFFANGRSSTCVQDCAHGGSAPPPAGSARGRALDCLHLWMQPAVGPPPAPEEDGSSRVCCSSKATTLAFARLLFLCAPACSHKAQGSPTVGRARRRRGANAEEERKVFGRWRLSLRGSACSEQAFGDTGVAGDDEKGEVADGQRVDVAIRSGRAGSASARGDGGGVLIVCITSCRVSTIRWRITCEVPTVVGPF